MFEDALKKSARIVRKNLFQRWWRCWSKFKFSLSLSFLISRWQDFVSLASETMSFKPPSARQEKQNRKILEDLQKKQQLLSGNNKAQGAPSSPVMPASSQNFLEASVNNNGKESRERTALQHAHQNSFGYFITQDSSFGNLILPVLPRF